MHPVANAADVQSRSIIQLGVVLMAFGVGGLLGFFAGRAFALTPNPESLTRAELHSNNAEYLAHRAIIGVGHIEGKRR